MRLNYIAKQPTSGLFGRRDALVQASVEGDRGLYEFLLSHEGRLSHFRFEHSRFFTDQKLVKRGPTDFAESLLDRREISALRAVGEDDPPMLSAAGADFEACRLKNRAHTVPPGLGKCPGIY